MDITSQIIYDMIHHNMFATRNFNAREIAFGTNSTSGIAFPSDEEHAYLFLFVHHLMGTMQAIRDYLNFKFKPNVVTIDITSGYRSPEHNANTPGSAKNSYHIWRVAAPGPLGLQIIDACDFRPKKNGIPSLEFTKQVFEEIRYIFKGEMYLNIPQEIIHYSPFKEEPSWVLEKN